MKGLETFKPADMKEYNTIHAGMTLQVDRAFENLDYYMCKNYEDDDNKDTNCFKNYKNIAESVCEDCGGTLVDGTCPVCDDPKYHKKNSSHDYYFG